VVGASTKLDDDTTARLHGCFRAEVSAVQDRALAARFRASARPLRTTSSRGFGFFTAQLTSALEALFALVLAQDAGFINTGLEAPQQLIEWLAFASFNVHL